MDKILDSIKDLPMNSIENLTTNKDPGLDPDSMNELLERLNGYAQIYEKLNRKTLVEELLHVDVMFYRNMYQDLAPYDYEATIQHYIYYGSLEGRYNSPYSTRDTFADYISSYVDAEILEIGPFTRPLIKGPRVKYADVYDTETLRKRATNFQLNANDVCDVHYVIPEMSLTRIQDKFDIVVTSHNIEHQPNLIKHVNEVYDLIKPGGRFCLIVPDHRYCFDANMPPTNIGDVLDAYYSDRKFHTLKNLIQHYCLAVHNNGKDHWQYQNSGTRSLYEPTDVIKVMKTLIKYANADKEFFLDAHAWYFTPWNFSDIMNCLIKLDLIKFKNVICNGTVENHQEFTCILEK